MNERDARVYAKRKQLCEEVQRLIDAKDVSAACLKSLIILHGDLDLAVNSYLDRGAVIPSGFVGTLVYFMREWEDRVIRISKSSQENMQRAVADGLPHHT
jgi:hypothetical protein